MDVTVLICTRDRQAMLARVLDSLTAASSRVKKSGNKRVPKKSSFQLLIYPVLV